MLRFSISRSWKFIIQVQKELAEFLELHSQVATSPVATLIQFRVELTTSTMTQSQMVLPLRDFNSFVLEALEAGASLSPYQSIDELILSLQTQVNLAFKNYCELNSRVDLVLTSFEIEFENNLKIKVQKNDLEIQDEFNLNIIHDLPTEDAAIHGHDLKVGVALAIKNWTTHPFLTSLQHFSLDLKNKTQKLLVEKLDKSILNRYFSSPTGEQISNHFFKVLQPTQIGAYLKEVRVFETRRNQYSTSEPKSSLGITD